MSSRLLGKQETKESAAVHSKLVDPLKRNARLVAAEESGSVNPVVMLSQLNEGLLGYIPTRPKGFADCVGMRHPGESSKEDSECRSWEIRSGIRL